MLGGLIRRTVVAAAVVVSITALVVARAGPPGAVEPAARPDYAGHPLVGAWTGPSVFDTDEPGIEIRADGRFSKLVRAPSAGAYLRAVGWGNEGWWEPWDGMGSPGVTFYPDGEWATVIAHVSANRDSITLTKELTSYGFDRLPPGVVAGEAPSVQPKGVFRAPSEDAYAAAVAGIWLLHAPPSVFGGDEAGVDLRTDGRWSKLRRQADGTLVRGAGWGDEGTWSAADISYPDRPGYQIALAADGGPALAPPAVLSADRQALRLFNPGGAVADYRLAPAGARINAAPASVVSGVYRPTGEDDFVRTVVGRWLLQTQPPAFRPDEAGLDIRPDHTWSWLARRADGSLAPTVGGPWVVHDTSAMNGPNAFAIDLQIDHPHGFNPLPIFSADRQVMRLSETSGTADYRRVTPLTPLRGPG